MMFSRFAQRSGCAILLACVAPMAVLAQSGELTSGISYSDRYGATGTLGLELNDLRDGALDAYATYRAGDVGSDASGGIDYTHDLGDTALGARTRARARLAGLVSDWSVNPYDSRAVDVLVGLGADLTAQARWSAAVAHNTTNVTLRADDVATILAHDGGQSRANWVELGLDLASTPDAGLFDANRRLGLLVASTFAADKDRDWHSVQLSAGIVQPVGAQLAFALRADASAITSQSDGGRVHVVDRYFANGRQPRGFAFGSPGPVDPVTGDALGGTRQLSLSAELRAPLPREGLSVAFFVDAGSVWDLAGDAGAGVHDDDDLRSAAGLALRLSTGFGQFEAAFAQPLSKMDFDVAQPLSLQFVTQF